MGVLQMPRHVVDPAPRGDVLALREVSLRDKYDLRMERVFVSGAQAIVRMLLMQRELDRRAGLNTAGFVSGYRGSPVAGIDQQLWQASQELSAASIVFQPGLNEELAATACWGSQQTELLGEGKHDGVFSLWYGKGGGWTAPETSFATRIWLAPRGMAASWR
jgi:indolepyruvate ferredoxin oxidoreductase